ncbi:MAG: ParA family protein [Defluviitaleaceae bacterium]|nr:ParA family protein [Defluviitaleaceae bacterium]
MGKTYIITGQYGSGKTEFCVNLAIQLAKSGESVTLADMDVINPYFRSREQAEMLMARGVEVVGSHLDLHNIQDLPAINFGFISRIRRGENVIIDLAGGENGLKILTRCYNAINPDAYEFLCVINRFRPDTKTAQGIIDFAEDVNYLSKLKLTGLVNNGNLLRETTAEHVLYSQEAIAEAAQILDLPIAYTMLHRDIYADLVTGGQWPPLRSEQLMILDELHMRKNWQ